MKDIIQRIKKLKIIPVIAIENAEDAVPLAEAFKDGGLPFLEITFRTRDALESMKRIRNEVPDVSFCAGTVINIEQAKQAIETGAEFLVSPGMDAELVNYCLENNVFIIPGCSNPSDMQKACSLGLDTVKFFPAEAMGGLKMLKALAGPFGQLSFIPTGGITSENVNEYLKWSRIIACGGSWMAPKELIANKKFDIIKKNVRIAISSLENNE